MVDASTNSLTPFSKVQLALSSFSRNALKFDTLLVQKLSTEFNEKRKNGLDSDTG